MNPSRIINIPVPKRKKGEVSKSYRMPSKTSNWENVMVRAITKVIPIFAGPKVAKNLGVLFLS